MDLAAWRRDCRIHAYVPMTNHVHILATPLKTDGVSRLMQDIGREYVRTINSSYRRSGTLWEGRFKSSLVDAPARFLARADGAPEPPLVAVHNPSLSIPAGSPR